MPSVPSCPWCHTNKAVHVHGDREFFCNKCKRLFDDNPNEGSDVYNDPTKRLEQQDDQHHRRQLRLAGRQH